jgi:hypothetical protein
MATLDDAHRIALSLPGVEEDAREFGFSVPHSGKVNRFLGMWRERVDPKKTKVPNPNVLVVVVKSLEFKELFISSEPAKFFTEPHYDGYAAILVRIAEVDVDELEELIVEAWRCMSPKEKKKE